jgi:hypothetical protein
MGFEGRMVVLMGLQDGGSNGFAKYKVVFLVCDYNH